MKSTTTMRIRLERRGPRPRPGPKSRLCRSRHHVRAILVGPKLRHYLASATDPMVPWEEVEFMAGCRGALLAHGISTEETARLLTELGELLVPHRAPADERHEQDLRESAVITMGAK